MRHTNFTTVQDTCNVSFFVIIMLLMVACGGTAISTSTTRDQLSETASKPIASDDAEQAPTEQIEPPAAVTAPKAEETADSKEADKQEAKGTVAEKAAESSPEPSQRVVSDKPLDEQIQATRMEIKTTKKTITKSSNKIASAEVTLRRATKAVDKLEDKFKAETATGASAQEKHKYAKERLDEANRILELAMDALNTIKEKEAKTPKQRADVQDSIESQKGYVGQKQGQVRKHTRAIEKFEEANSLSKARADKIARKIEEKQDEIDKAQKEIEVGKQSIDATEKELTSLAAHLTLLQRKKKEEKQT